MLSTVETKPAIEVVLDNLHARYVRAIDAQDMTAWLNCFATVEDASYICLSAENDKHGNKLALIYDDCRARLEDRVTVVSTVWTGTYVPYKTRHFVQRVAHREEAPGVWATESHFQVIVCREGEMPFLFTSGVYRDLVRVHGDQALLWKREAVYDSDVLPHYIVFPL